MRFLFVDRIVHLVPGELVRGIKHITQDDAYLCQDEAGKWCFIPSLIGETLGQLAAWNVMHSTEFSRRPVAGVVSSAKLHRAAYIGETLLLESFIESLDEQAVQYRSRAYVNEDLVFSVDGAIGPLLPMSDFIAEDTVRRQFTDIHRPGTWPSSNHLPSCSLPVPAISRPSMCFDRVIQCEPGVSLLAQKSITAAAPFFADHFPRKPVLPMTVLLECKLNLAREFLARSAFPKTYDVHELRKIKMNDFVYPGDVLVCQLTLKQRDDQQVVLSFRSEVEGKRVCVVELVLLAKEGL